MKLRRFISRTIIIVLIFSFVFANIKMNSFALTEDERIEYNKSITVESNQVMNWPEGPIVSAESAILIDADTGAILYEKNIHAKQFPASTTKILTCLIAAENCEMDEVVTFSRKAVMDTPRDSNHIAIDVGESLTVEECLQAILIRSANECTFALAEHIIGADWEEFASVMNEKAESLGCVDSNFVNPNGLPDDNHYTSAYDLAQIGRAFFANETLCEISRMTRLHLYPSENQPDEIIENSANLILAGKTYEYEYLVGSKTGYTETARSCLVSCAEKDGVRLICVVLKDEAPYQFIDTISLFDYGFSNFNKVNVAETETKYNISTTGSFYSGIDVLGNSSPILALNMEDSIICPRTVSFDDLESVISYDTDDSSQAAIITYSYNGVFLGTASVDFAISKDAGYTFDEIPESVAAPEAENEELEEEKVVFVNVIKIARIVGIVVVVGGIIFLIFRGMYLYRKNHPNSRANWKRERRRRKSGNYLNFSNESKKRAATFRQESRRRKRGNKSLNKRFK